METGYLLQKIKSNQKLLIFLLLGLILIGFGALAYKTNVFSSGDSVEVLPSTTENNNAGPESPQDLIVEISGSIEKPGVYKLKMGDRIDDLLVVSGGLSVDADREWVTKNVNRASKLIDGQKIYVYSQSEVESAKESGGIKLYQEVLSVNDQNLTNLVNINTASQSELEKLDGIGPVYATNIIEHRPYSNVDELVKKGAISQKVLEKIKNAISVN
jgi:competence protein ComEA